MHGAAGWQKIVRGIFGIEPRFDGVAVSARGFCGSSLTFRDLDLQAHQIEPSNQFGYRMFHLNARVHLDEIKPAGWRQQKLNGSGIGVADGAADRDRGLAHASAQIVRERGRGSLFDDLLVAALDGTIALEQVDQLAVQITENLEFDVARVLRYIARSTTIRRRTRAPLRGRADSRASAMSSASRNDPHSAPAAARRSLDQHRESHVAARWIITRQRPERRPPAAISRASGLSVPSCE